MNRSMLRRRGAAAVEMAISMLLIIPLVLYTIFLEDMLSYRLENQEPTIVAAWDYITNDYMRGSGLKAIGGYNRLKYCDHTAAFDSYDKGFDCQGMNTANGAGEDPGSGGSGSELGESGEGPGATGHHMAGGAHECWIVPGADQLRCSTDSTGGALATAIPSASAYLASSWNRGGMVTCHARLGVMNYMLPNKILLFGEGTTAGSKVSMSGGKGRMRDGQTFKQIDDGTTDKSIHGDAPGGSGNSWILKQEDFSVMSDSWALNDIKEVGPGEGAPLTSTKATRPGAIPGSDTYHPLLDRSGHYYNYYSGDALDKAMKWFDEDPISGNDGLLDSNLAKIDGLGGMGADWPGSLPVAWKPAIERQVDSDYASGWKNDNRQEKSSKRDSKYPWGK